MPHFHEFFQETKRPSKEMQVTIARQLGLDPSTVSNFFMNARRRSVDKWKDDKAEMSFTDFDDEMGEEPRDPSPEPGPLAFTSTTVGSHQTSGLRGPHYQDHSGSIKNNAVLVTSANPAAVAVQHLQQPQEAMTPTAALDL